MIFMGSRPEIPMPIRETLTAKPVTLAEVLSNGKRYIVPSFQRDYAWEKDEWSELWADILAVHRAPPENNHYLGALVLQPTHVRSDSKVIDGQQRLVTLSLLALAVIGALEKLAKSGSEPIDNTERVRLLREKFISTKDSASLQHRSRLELNEHDDNFFQTYLVQGHLPSRPSALKGSEQRLYQAFVFFQSAIQELGDDAQTGASLARFLEETVGTKLRFIEIVVEDDETAFTVFETLNSRGVALGTADLLKNFIYASAAKGGQSDLDQARRWWDQIVALVPLDRVATFLFHQLSTRVADMREKRVFSEVKRIVPAQSTVFDFLRDTKEAAEIYAALDDPTGDFWKEFPPPIQRHVHVLDILRVEQCRPVILAAFPRFADAPDKMRKFLWNLLVVSLRALVSRVNTGDLQRRYHQVALSVHRGELKSPLAIARALGTITPSDDDFKSAFAQFALDPKGPRKRLVRYLLSELEVGFGGARVEFASSDVSIEHILPENAGGEWESFTYEDRQRDVRRLGNLTPLEFATNQALGSVGYLTKRSAYGKSRYAMTSAIDAAEWTHEAIGARQLLMAEHATRIWRIEDGE